MRTFSILRLTKIVMLLFFVIQASAYSAAFEYDFTFSPSFKNGEKLFNVLKQLKNSTLDQEKQTLRTEALRLLALPEDQIDANRWVENDASISTSLGLAITSNERQVVLEILRHKNLDQRFELSEPFLACEFQEACKSGYNDLVALTIHLLTQKEKNYFLENYAFNNDLSLLQLLLSHGANPCTKPHYGYPLITHLIERYTTQVSIQDHPQYYDNDIKPPSQKFLARCRESLAILISAKGFLDQEEIVALKKAPQELQNLVMNIIQQKRHAVVEIVNASTQKLQWPTDLSSLIADFAVAP